MEICLENLRFSYPSRNQKLILNIPIWSVETSEVILINGPSGSGKTTLLNLLSGLLIPDKGSLSVHGNRLDLLSSQKRDFFRANYLGYVFQQFNLIPYLNVIDNIRLATYFSSKKESKNITEEIDNLLHALNIRIEDWGLPSRNLSLGQQQRVAIARALINKPRIVLADEPTSSLDDANKEVFMKLLLPLVKKYGITLIFVSHDHTLREYFTRVESFSDINIVESLD